MGWISIYHSPTTGWWSRSGGQLKALCLEVVLFGMISHLSSLPTAQAEENHGERKLIARIEPEYPEALQRLYIGGVVRLELTIAAKGNVENVTLLGGNPILGQSAMAAAKKWKYAPANSRTVTEVKIPFDPHR
jgi:TonB family protein